jgi:hypothetical protein
MDYMVQEKEQSEEDENRDKRIVMIELIQE